MPKGEEHKRDDRKKPKATLKEKRQRKKDKKLRVQSEHSIENVE